MKIVLVRFSQQAPTWLLHISLLLAIIAGAGLATLARLKWDPSAYLVFRGLLPTEYRVLTGLLILSTFLMIALAHLAVTALNIRKESLQHIRRAMFFTYCGLMVALIVVETCTTIWLGVRVFEWVQTNEAAKVLSFVRVLQYTISRKYGFQEFPPQYYEIVRELHNDMEEILYDLPFNVYVGVFFVVLTAILQPIAVLLAWNSAFTYTENIKSIEVVHSIRYKSNISKEDAKTDDADKEKESKHNVDMYLDALKK